MIVVAKYARVSTGEQLDGFGLEDQNQISEERAGLLMETLGRIGFQNDRIYPLSGRIDSLCGAVCTGMGRGAGKRAATAATSFTGKCPHTWRPASIPLFSRPGSR